MTSFRRGAIPTPTEQVNATLRMCVVLILTCVGISNAVAQSSATANESSTASSSSAKNNAQILQELETMRSRIAELEAQLKQRSQGVSADDPAQPAESYVN